MEIETNRKKQQQKHHYKQTTSAKELSDMSVSSWSGLCLFDTIIGCSYFEVALAFGNKGLSNN